jgi:tetratricopeptide (TPR) repeat protein
MAVDSGAIDTVSIITPNEATKPEASASEGTAGRPPTAWQLTKLWLKRAIALSTAIPTVMIAVWIVWLVGEATLRSHSLDVEAIGVPKRLAEDGFSAEVATQRLRDAIKAVQDTARTTMAKAEVGIHPSLSEVTIPKAGFSAESVAASIRRLLPESWHHEISGEFTSSGNDLSIRLRLNGQVVFSDTTTAPDAIDTLLKRGAFELVRRTQPYVAASSLYAEDKFTAAEALADQIIATRPPDDENAIRAHNLKGLLIASDPLKSEEAIKEFSTAIKLDPKFAAPRYNLVNLLRGRGKLDEANRELEILTRLDPDLAKKLENGAGGVAEGG